MFNNALMVCDFLNRECPFSCIKGKQKGYYYNSSIHNLKIDTISYFQYHFLLYLGHILISFIRSSGG